MSLYIDPRERRERELREYIEILEDEHRNRIAPLIRELKAIQESRFMERQIEIDL